MGHARVAELLLDRGANIDAQNNMGWSALHCASHKGHEEVVKLLLWRGASVKLRSDEGRTAEQEAANERITRLFKPPYHMYLNEAARCLLIAGKREDCVVATVPLHVLRMICHLCVSLRNR